MFYIINILIIIIKLLKIRNKKKDHNLYIHIDLTMYYFLFRAFISYKINFAVFDKIYEIHLRYA